MNMSTRGFLLTAVAAMVMMLTRQGYADTVEQKLEKLDKTVTQLEEVVNQQNREIWMQRELIKDLQAQVVPVQEEEKSVLYLDKHLLHERSGLGEQLGNMRIGVGLTGVVQGSIDADDVSRMLDDEDLDPSEKDRDQTDGSWSMDLEIESPIGEHGLGFMLIEAGQGDGLTDELAAVFHGVNDDAGDGEARLEVTEAWYEHSFCEERVALTVGKLDLSNYVDGNAVANDETAQFLNTGLVNSLTIEFPEDNGAGVRLGICPTDWVEFNVGWAESDADWEDIFNDGFGITEINFKPNFIEREGNYRFYAWVNGSDHEEIDGGDDDENGWGCGLSFDQQITDCFTAFVRAGLADDEVYEIEGSWSAGADIRGTKWNRENDVLGFALSQALINDKLEDDDTETLLEVYYSIILNDHLAISPDIQIIDNPGGDSHNDTVVVIGTRAQLIF